MEKPKNYWLRAYVANIAAALCLIPLIILLSPTIYHFVALTFTLLWEIALILIPIGALIAIFAGPLSIVRGVEFKDWKYILWGIISLIMLCIAFVILGKLLSNGFGFVG